MKNKEEYINSIYKKRDEAIKKRKKRISYLTTAGCIVICFLTAFFLVPKDRPKVKEWPSSTSHYSPEFTEMLSTLIFGESQTANDRTVNDANVRVEGNKKETTYFGSAEDYSDEGNQETENAETCTVVSTASAQTSDSATVKASKTTTKRNYSKGTGSSTVKNDTHGAGDSSINLEDVLDGIDSILSDDIKWPFPVATIGAFQGDSPTQKNTTTEHIAPDTGGDDLSDVLSTARSYLSEYELKRLDSSKTEINITRSSSGKYIYNVYFQTDTKAINITLDVNTLEFLGREEQELSRAENEIATTTESATAPARTASSTTAAETTAVTQPVTENN